MGVATAERPVIRKSKLASRKRRRNRLADRAKALQESGDYLMLRSCGWDVRSRDMRHREPPTRSCNGKGTRLNKRNAWHQDGDAKKLVTPEESATWNWWLTLDEGDQNEVMDLSAKVRGKTRDGGGTYEEADAMEMLAELRDAPKRDADEKRLLTFAGEDVRQWGKR